MAEVTNEFEPGQVAILLREGDDVAVAKARIAAGSVVRWEGGETRLVAYVPAGHKFALTSVAEGQPVFKYGMRHHQIIGYATATIRPGDWVHVKNLGFAAGTGDGTNAPHPHYEYATDVPAVDYVWREERRAFPSYARRDGCTESDTLCGYGCDFLRGRGPAPVGLMGTASAHRKPNNVAAGPVF